MERKFFRKKASGLKLCSEFKKKKRTALAHSPDYQPNSLRMFDWGCEPNSSRINIFREKLWIFSYVETKCFLIGDSV